jgi:BirA family transcriptional regulator, biotin operon repressor / biotin---[acetyl-CoA-carboxylase] ligase
MSFLNEAVIHKRSVTSTNDFMLNEISDGIISNEGTVVTAYEQTVGKGTDDNTWESEPGKNLTFSVLLKPTFLRADRQFLLNKVVSLAVYDFLKMYITDIPVKIKWPNDIYIGNGKVAGILINNTVSGNSLVNSVAGIGININQEKFSGKASNPVSMIHSTGRILNRDKCLEEILKCLEVRYLELSQGNLFRINTDYLTSLYRHNESHFYRYQELIVKGMITGISAYGHLKVTLQDNRKIECDLKEIEFIINEAIE